MILSLKCDSYRTYFYETIHSPWKFHTTLLEIMRRGSVLVLSKLRLDENFVYIITKIVVRTANSKTFAQLQSFPFQVWCINYPSDFSPLGGWWSNIKSNLKSTLPHNLMKYPQKDGGSWVPLVHAVNKWYAFSRWSWQRCVSIENTTKTFMTIFMLDINFSSLADYQLSMHELHTSRCPFPAFSSKINFLCNTIPREKPPIHWYDLTSINHLTSTGFQACSYFER